MPPTLVLNVESSGENGINPCPELELQILYECLSMNWGLPKEGGCKWPSFPPGDIFAHRVSNYIQRPVIDPFMLTQSERIWGIASIQLFTVAVEIALKPS